MPRICVCVSSEVMRQQVERSLRDSTYQVFGINVEDLLITVWRSVVDLYILDADLVHIVRDLDPFTAIVVLTTDTDANHKSNVVYLPDYRIRELLPIITNLLPIPKEAANASCDYFS